MLKFDRLVTLRVSVPGDDGLSAVETWTDLPDKVWAGMRVTAATERLRAGNVDGHLQALVVLRRFPVTEGLTLKDQLVIAGKVWSITGIQPAERPDLLELTVAREAGT